MNIIHRTVHLSTTVVLALALSTCSETVSPDMAQQHTNALIHETSPYLLQHAHNPVNWLPWGEDALQKSLDEDKPLIISIGYSACHWCHVMEHESFEDEAVAAYMNEHFVCIKVDREERPDVDQIYMDAVQLITGRGGWPLNCFALPDGRPFHGGTYFPKDQWLGLLQNVASAFKTDREKLEEYATRLTDGLSAMDEMPVQRVPQKFTDESVSAAVGKWQQKFDRKEGGGQGAPKFPMPNNLMHLLAFSEVMQDEDVQAHVTRTLDKLAFGGIYDQIGGGFARYSTDDAWRVPHFEKMLYDNGQLLSVYAKAYQKTKEPTYLKIIEETVQWIEREMTDPSGAFYSALDADSEGQEGKFYVWKKDDLERLAGDEVAVIQAYYHLDRKGLWEHGNYILMRRGKEEDIAKELKIGVTDLRQKIEAFNIRLMRERDERIRPGLDDKSLTSWNALTSTGLLDAYIATGQDRYRELAEQNLAFIEKKQWRSDGGLWHSYKGGKSTINGYLEDYAFTIEAYLKMHAATLDPAHLEQAKRLLEETLRRFERNENGFFYFKPEEDDPLVAKKVEIHDNVIPASNSVLATCLFKLGLLYGDPSWLGIADVMLANVEPNFSRYPTGHSQWMSLMLLRSHRFFEIAIVGKDCEEKRKELAQHYLPSTVLCGSKSESNIPILADRWTSGQTRIYVCESGACQLPVEEVDAALAQLRRP